VEGGLIMTAKEKAISDIKSDLYQEGKVFLAYNPNLNPIIEDITKEYLLEQEKL